MDDTQSSAIKRNVSFSRRLSTIGGPNVSGKWSKLVFLTVVLTLGIISGNFIFRLVFGQTVDGRIKHVKRQNIHEPPNSRPGISIKKDLSIQFRDYLPSNVFITTGHWFNQRESLKLFIQTYPDGAKYKLYCFLEDDSLDAFFKPFENLSIIKSKVIGNTNKTIHRPVHSFGSGDVDKNMTEIDFGAWLIDSFHQDDYIVLRMENENETDIVKHMDKIGALEWIDKYYTTSRDNDTHSDSVYHEVFKKLNIPLYIWDDNNMIFSDFGDLNDLAASKDTTTVITQCGYHDQFLLVMYVPFASKQSIYALEVLKEFAGIKYLQTAVFLSKDFILEQIPLTESLTSNINVGIFIENNTYFDNSNSYSHIRNDFVEMERTFQQFVNGRVNIKYALTDVTENLASQLSDERFVNIFKDTINLNYLIPTFLQEHSVDFKNIQRKHGQILALDLSVENSELLMVYMIKKYGPESMVTIKSCL